MREANTNSLVSMERKNLATLDVPSSIADAGPAATFAWEEFFIGKIRNAYTRRAYLHAVRSFLGWIEARQVELVRVTPGMVGHYLDGLTVATPTKKLYLAGIRAFFDVLVQRHVVVLNPAHSVRAPRYSALEGKTPEITVEQCRKLLASIALNRAVDYRDRAIIAVLIYTAARAGAVGRLRIKDFAHDGTQYGLRFAEKGGKSRLIPVRADLERYIKEYLFAAGMEDQGSETPLFRTMGGRRGIPTGAAMSNIDICRMVKRRLSEAGLPSVASSHSFRACAATDLLLQGVPLEDVQYLLGHSDSRVTKLYDRRARQVTRNIVERISV
jgi:site-specific recombinase XerD